MNHAVWSHPAVSQTRSSFYLATMVMSKPPPMVHLENSNKIKQVMCLSSALICCNVQNLVTLSSLDNQIFSCLVFTFQLLCLIGSHSVYIYTRPEGKSTTKQPRSSDEKTNCCLNGTISLQTKKEVWKVTHLLSGRIKHDKYFIVKVYLGQPW